MLRVTTRLGAGEGDTSYDILHTFIHSWLYSHVHFDWLCKTSVLMVEIQRFYDFLKLRRSHAQIPNLERAIVRCPVTHNFHGNLSKTGPK